MDRYAELLCFFDVATAPETVASQQIAEEDGVQKEAVSAEPVAAVSGAFVKRTTVPG